MDFELRNDVTMDDYMKMISYKTAVLLACALQMGAIIANASEKDLKHIYNYGLYLGTAFQLQDDYLDTFGSKEFGKKVGGDILGNKKTFLFIMSIDLASKEDKEELFDLYDNKEPSQNKIDRVIELFNKYKIKELLFKEIITYTEMAFSCVDKLSLERSDKNSLVELGKNLMNRKI
jgi:geranylgeranyl diphosphate synthase type II